MARGENDRATSGRMGETERFVPAAPSDAALPSLGSTLDPAEVARRAALLGPAAGTDSILEAGHRDSGPLEPLAEQKKDGCGRSERRTTLSDTT